MQLYIGQTNSPNIPYGHLMQDGILCVVMALTWPVPVLAHKCVKSACSQTSHSFCLQKVTPFMGYS